MTVISLKELRRKAKAAKQIKQLERKAKQPFKRLSEYQHKQAMKLSADASLAHRFNRINAVIPPDKLTDEEMQEAYFSDTEVQECYEADFEALENLVYQREIPESITRIELTVRAAKIVGEMLQDESPRCSNDLLEVAAKAEQVIRTTIAGESPNQRQAQLYHVYTLIDLLKSWNGALSKELLNEIATYNSGVQAAAYFLNLYQMPNEMAYLATEIIKGESVRNLAKRTKIKEPDLRIQLLKAAQFIYRIGMTRAECAGIQPALSIPDMRQPEWKPLGDFDVLTNISGQAVWHIIRPFTLKYGIDLVNLSAYEQAIVQVQKRILLL